jgi:hypothetical protein
VSALQLSREAIMRSIVERRLFLSSLPYLWLGAHNTDSEPWSAVGDTLARKEKLRLRLTWGDTRPDNLLKVRKDGQEIHHTPAYPAGQAVIEDLLSSSSWTQPGSGPKLVICLR